MTGDPQLPEQERRRFSRIEIDRPASLETLGQTWATRTLDISLRGVLVERPEGWEGAAGDPCTVQVELEGEGAGIRMEGTVVHQNDQRIGVRCEHIDVASSARLRRLVELNLGDPALVDRELASLV